MKAEKPLFWVLLGPSLLLAAVVLLFFKAAFVVGRPVWMFGLSFAIVLASLICYWTFKELGLLEENGQALQRKQRGEIESLRSVLDETHLLYRDKIAALEKGVQEQELQQKSSLAEKEGEIEELQQTSEELFAQLAQQKALASSIRASLEDALEELRHLRHLDHLQKNWEKKIPVDLANQHRQLREQFEEKSAVLDQTRKRLFATEGHLIALEKEKEDVTLSLNEEQDLLLSEIQRLVKENEGLDREIAALEELVGFKPVSGRKPKKRVDEILEFQFDNFSN